MRTWGGSAATSGWLYLAPYGGYDVANTYSNAMNFIPPGTYTNFYVSQFYNGFTGTNIWIIFTNKPGGTPTEAMRCNVVSPAASANNLYSNVTASFTVAGRTCCVIGVTNTSGSANNNPFTSWSIDKY